MRTERLDACQGVFDARATAAMVAAYRQALEMAGDLRGSLDEMSGLNLRKAVASAVVREARGGAQAPEAMAWGAVARLLRLAERSRRERTHPVQPLGSRALASA
jgi:hypothetical protein